jgi:hypothetical protein
VSIDAGERELLHRAVSRAAKILGIDEAELVLMVDPAVDSDSTRFVMLYRNLLQVTGEPETARTWLNGYNNVFGATPRMQMVKQGGLQEVANYLNAVAER